MSNLSRRSLFRAVVSVTIPLALPHERERAYSFLGQATDDTRLLQAMISRGGAFNLGARTFLVNQTLTAPVGSDCTLFGGAIRLVGDSRNAVFDVSGGSIRMHDAVLELNGRANYGFYSKVPEGYLELTGCAMSWGLRDEREKLAFAPHSWFEGFDS